MDKEQFDELVSKFLTGNTTRSEEQKLLVEYISGHNDLLLLKCRYELEEINNEKSWF